MKFVIDFEEFDLFLEMSHSASVFAFIERFQLHEVARTSL